MYIFYRLHSFLFPSFSHVRFSSMNDEEQQFSGDPWFQIRSRFKLVSGLRENLKLFRLNGQYYIYLNISWIIVDVIYYIFKLRSARNIIYTLIPWSTILSERWRNNNSVIHTFDISIIIIINALETFGNTIRKKSYVQYIADFFLLNIIYLNLYFYTEVKDLYLSPICFSIPSTYKAFSMYVTFINYDYATLCVGWILIAGCPACLRIQNL